MQILILILVVGVVGFFVARALVPSLSPTPDNLGVSDGKLAACPNTPNCVSTQADSDDSHAIEPITFEGSAADAKSELLRVVQQMPRATIVTEDDNYLHVEFRSAMWGFIDDFEAVIDADSNTIHMRSAARLGMGDMGVNRNRIEAIRRRYAQS